MKETHIWLNNLPLFVTCLPKGNNYNIRYFHQDGAGDVLVHLEYDDEGFNQSHYDSHRVRYSDTPDFHHCVSVAVFQGSNVK